MEFTTQSEATSSIPFLTEGAVGWEHDPLASSLIELGKVKRSELYQLQEVSRSRTEALGVALVKYGILSKNDLAKTLSELTGLPVLDAADYSEIESAPEQLPLRFLKSSLVIPVAWDDETMVLADPVFALWHEPPVLLRVTENNKFAKHLLGQVKL